MNAEKLTDALSHMLMRIKMLFTIFIVPVALGTEAEGKFRISHLVPAADRTLMLCHALGTHGLAFEFFSPLHLPRAESVEPFIGIEENQEVQHSQAPMRGQNLHPADIGKA